MADQGKWFKLWCSSLHDEALENLSLEDWARWARLGAYVKEHGEDGKIRFSPPYRALLNLFRVPTFEAAKMVLQLFPNCTLGDRNLTVSPATSTSVSLEIEFTNWHKFQSDLSSNRVRNFRARKRQRETIQEEKRSRREQKRKEESRPTLDMVAEFVKTENLKIDAKRFFNFYEASGWMRGKTAIRNWKACARNWTPDQDKTPQGQLVI